MNSAEEIHVRPFSKAYVVNRAIGDSKDSIDRSINYATTRLEDFDKGGDKWMEVLHTLHVLHKIRQVIDDFAGHNQHLINEDKET